MSIITFIPPRDDDPPPTPTAPALPPLLDVTCPTCLGDGWVEDYTTGYRCPECEGSGYGPTVCSGCLQVPTVDSGGLEACGCNSETANPVLERCELCTEPAERLNTANICPACHRQGVEQLEQEADEHDALIHAEVEWALKHTSWLGVGA